MFYDFIFACRLRSSVVVISGSGIYTAVRKGFNILAGVAITQIGTDWTYTLFFNLYQNTVFCLGLGLIFLFFCRLSWKYSCEYSSIIANVFGVWKLLKLFWSEPGCNKKLDIRHITSFQNLIVGFILKMFLKFRQINSLGRMNRPLGSTWSGKHGINEQW